MISLNWVKDYIDIEDQDVYELASSITKAGINVEQVISRDIKGLVIGEIKSVEDHPDSDHLHICMVDVGTDTLQIICGAHNVREKLKVIVALPGSILPGDFEIKKSKIRGVESNGMICALFELGLEEKTDETYAKGITELSNDAPVGGNPISYLGLDDTLYDLDVHKHRNNDCYYHIGFAYEIAAILNRKVKLPSVDFKTIKEDIKSNFNLKVDTKKCSYYTARLVRDVTIGESPEFIQKRLTALFKVLKQASVDKKAYTISDSNTAVAATGKTIRQVVEENFDLNAWAEGFIINAIACPPDVGYSSFYMSFDNSSTGDKKLRFDCPWDFDSNFGNRSRLCEGGDSGEKDPYYLDRTSNMWLQCLSKLDFFINDYVKPLWNKVRNEKVFEDCIDMLKVYYKVYANEHKKNFAKWTKIAAQDGDNVGTYFNGELRSIFKNTDENSRKNAQKETINWFSKRVNYFERKWGENRPNLPTIS